MVVPQCEDVPEGQAALVVAVVLGKDLLKLLLHSHKPFDGDACRSAGSGELQLPLL